ncbi:hypothetical protein [Pelovirga terrestris]|uniref:Uncharacterized protein n=1 Tax=Pelovirga terrestris TaxID=2771352 RepID=A0A8J6QVJ9_9BACT|nr:hypothetical protein [Pelovirga terrestris]MBD1401810.1 hypothetical protein [Pelovirga terrestris]
MVALIILLIVAVSWSGYIDRQTENYVNQATVQALAAFATARVLNAGISVAKSVEVGAVVSVQPLEILDPVHDLVEQYSAIMKLAIGSLVIQKVLLEIVATGFFKVVLTLLAVLLLATLLVGSANQSTLMFKLFALACLVRFLLILAVGLNGLVDNIYVNNKTQQNMVELEVLSLEVDALTAAKVPDETSWHSGITSKFSAAIDLINLENLKRKAEVAVPAMLNLMALFILKTLLLPLLFLWLLLRGFRVIWGVNFGKVWSSVTV